MVLGKRKFYSCSIKHFNSVYQGLVVECVMYVINVQTFNTSDFMYYHVNVFLDTVVNMYPIDSFHRERKKKFLKNFIACRLVVVCHFYTIYLQYIWYSLFISIYQWGFSIPFSQIWQKKEKHFITFNCYCYRHCRTRSYYYPVSGKSSPRTLHPYMDRGSPLNSSSMSKGSVSCLAFFVLDLIVYFSFTNKQMVKIKVIFNR